MTTATRLEVLDPTVGPIPVHAVMAPRPETLDRTSLGLLANGKRNADELLEYVHEVLADRFEFKSVTVRNKDNACQCGDPKMTRTRAWGHRDGAVGPASPG